MQATASPALIGATYAARNTELIYRHLRENLECDDDINKFVADLMEETPSRALQKHPSLPIGASDINIALRDNPVRTNNPTPQPPNGPATLPPPQLSLLNHIEEAYRNLKDMEYERYLQHITTRLNQVPRQGGDGYQDPDFLRVEGWLNDYVEVAEEFLELNLSNRTKVISPLKFHGKTRRRFIIGILFWAWLGLAIGFFYLSALDDQCSLIMEKHEDWVQYWVSQININELPSWCVRGVSSSELSGIQNIDPAAILSYMQARRWRSCVFFNLSILVFGALIAKIVANFVTGEPGFAGFRLNGTFGFWIFKYKFKHRDPELACDPKYHIRRYLECKGIYLPDFDGKYQIDQIYEAHNTTPAIEIHSPHLNPAARPQEENHDDESGNIRQ